MSPTSIRRNLFHQTLSRRPASTGPPNGAGIPPKKHSSSNSNSSDINVNDDSSASASGLSNRPPHHRIKSAPTETARSIKLPENREIVVRDKNGGYKLDTFALPPRAVDGEEGEELDDPDGEENGESTLDGELSGMDKEKFEAALVEMMIRHRNRQSTGEPDEILNIVHQSLRKKVASLDDDNWMFEPEKDARV